MDERSLDMMEAGYISCCCFCLLEWTGYTGRIEKEGESRVESGLETRVGARVSGKRERERESGEGVCQGRV